MSVAGTGLGTAVQLGRGSDLRLPPRRDGIVASIVDAHGWDVPVTESDRGGARFEVSGLERAPSDEGPLAE